MYRIVCVDSYSIWLSVFSSISICILVALVVLVGVKYFLHIKKIRALQVQPHVSPLVYQVQESQTIDDQVNASHVIVDSYQFMLKGHSNASIVSSIQQVRTEAFPISSSLNDSPPENNFGSTLKIYLKRLFVVFVLCFLKCFKIKNKNLCNGYLDLITNGITFNGKHLTFNRN